MQLPPPLSVFCRDGWTAYTMSRARRWTQAATPRTHSYPLRYAASGWSFSFEATHGQHRTTDPSGTKGRDGGRMDEGGWEQPLQYAGSWSRKEDFFN